MDIDERPTHVTTPDSITSPPKSSDLCCWISSTLAVTMRCGMVVGSSSSL